LLGNTIVRRLIAIVALPFGISVIVFLIIWLVPPGGRTDAGLAVGAVLRAIPALLAGDPKAE
jgi:hypothetical protein